MGRSPFGSSMSAAASLATAVVVLVFSTADAAPNNLYSYGVLSLKYRYAGQEMSLSAFKAHDIQRQQHLLAGVDLPLGGTGRPDAVGYFQFNFLFYSFLFSFVVPMN
ncbi:hypothetical protein MLD38_018187 [Melastoma candidum]|uniref:Uncharacterized protein n=1 Tax=Melastoma candidum TaxID=119954 RepID=A0ACB9QX39_9MYRT|nr:hypothetical protein MLD38_018187 [Melastoma candidum]